MFMCVRMHVVVSSLFMDLLILYNRSVVCASLQNVTNSSSTTETFLREFSKHVHFILNFISYIHKFSSKFHS